jgi:L-alanine-DL-glutamate epimerase-like enolase superfamily enzyme
MASTNVGVQEMPKKPGTYSTDFFPVQIQWDEGYAWANDAPGLGIEWDEGKMRNSIIPATGWPTQLRRNDGAFTNW